MCLNQSDSRNLNNYIQIQIYKEQHTCLPKPSAGFSRYCVSKSPESTPSLCTTCSSWNSQFSGRLEPSTQTQNLVNPSLSLAAAQKNVLTAIIFTYCEIANTSVSHQPISEEIENRKTLVKKSIFFIILPITFLLVT